MAGNFSRVTQQDILEYYFGGYSTAVSASTYWFHLYNTTLNDANTPATTGRCAGSNYNPKNLANTTVNFSAPTAADPSAAENKVELVFTTSASTGWGTLKALQVATSSGTGGRSIAWADLSTDQVVLLGNTVKLSTGAWDVTLT